MATYRKKPKGDNDKKEYTVESARKKALELLLHMDRTEGQLRERLVRAGISEELVEDAIEYVKELHYIDDRRYATYYVELHRQDKSYPLLRRELQKRRISQELVDEVMRDYSREDENAAVQKLIEKRCRGQEELTESFIQKLWGYLMRQGYSGECVREEIENLRNRFRKY